MSSSDYLHSAPQTTRGMDGPWSRRSFPGASAMTGLGLGLSPALAWAEGGGPTLPVRRRMVDVFGELFHVVEQGEGHAVLFCHGFPDTAATWRSQMQAVAAAGYRAVALDMRGYGRSLAAKNPDLYAALHIAGDLIGVLDALLIETAVIVGHDWGAYHSRLAALMRPDRFRALVSISIPFAPRCEVDPWQFLCELGLGDRYYAFDFTRPGADTQTEQIIPTSTRFAVAAHILTALAFTDGKPLRCEDLAHSVNTGAVVICGLLSRLAEAGLTRSQLGSSGGAPLAKAPNEIRLLDVYRAVEDAEFFVIHRQPPRAECPMGANILGAINPALTRAQAAMEAELGSTTIAEIAGLATASAVA